MVCITHLTEFSYCFSLVKDKKIVIDKTSVILTNNREVLFVNICLLSLSRLLAAAIFLEFDFNTDRGLRIISETNRVI